MKTWKLKPKQKFWDTQTNGWRMPNEEFELTDEARAKAVIGSGLVHVVSITDGNKAAKPNKPQEKKINVDKAPHKAEKPKAAPKKKAAKKKAARKRTKKTEDKEQPSL